MRDPHRLYALYFSRQAGGKVDSASAAALPTVASPALLLQKSIDKLAGEDLARQQLFLFAAKQHIQKLRDYYREPAGTGTPIPAPGFTQLTHSPAPPAWSGRAPF